MAADRIAEDNKKWQKKPGKNRLRNRGRFSGGKRNGETGMESR